MSLGAPDLVAQKIIGSGQEGFGEGAVLPYRHENDPIPAALDRIALLKHQHQKENADNLNDQLKRFPEINRRVKERQLADRNQIIQQGLDLVSKGVNVSTHPEFLQNLEKHIAEGNSVNQYEKDYDHKKAEIGQLGEFVNKPVLLKKLQDEYEMGMSKVANNGDYSDIQKGFTVKGDDPEAFDMNRFLAATTKNFGDTVVSKDTLKNGPLGQMIYQDKDKYKFATDKDGKIAKPVIDYFLRDPTNDPNMLQYRAALDNVATKAQENEAIELNNDPNSAYYQKGVSKIMDLQARPGTDIYFDKEAYKNDLAQKGLAPYQQRETSHDIKNGFKYDKSEGTTTTSYGSNPAAKFVAEPAIIQEKSASGLEHNMPGVEISHKDKPIDFQVAPKQLLDLGGGKIESNKDRIPFKASSLGYAIQTKNSKKLVASGGVDQTVDWINNLTPAEAKKYDLKQFLFGNITENENTEGDTGADLERKLKGSPTTKENRTVAIEYDPKGETGARLRTLSGGRFNEKRQLSEEEQRVVDAWSNKQEEVKTIDAINKMYPNATPEQKAAIYKDLINQ